MRVPSGDHAGCVAYAASMRAPPPSAADTMSRAIACVPLRSVRANARRVPSGDHAGSPSSAPVVNARTGPPAAGRATISRAPFAAGRTAAIVAPSGDQAGRRSPSLPGTFASVPLRAVTMYSPPDSPGSPSARTPPTTRRVPSGDHDGSPSVTPRSAASRTAPRPSPPTSSSPPSATASVAARAGAASASALSPESASDDHLLDLIRAFPDGEDLGVAVEAAHRVLLDVAVAPVDLDRFLGRADRQAAGDQLCLSGGQRE